MRLHTCLLLSLALFSARAEGKEKDDEIQKVDKPTCVWLDPVDGKRNSGNEKVTLKDISIDDCKKHVENEMTTMYMSFEYHKTSRICYLQLVDRFTTSLTISDVNYVYYERDCRDNYPDECQWEGPMKEHYLHGGNLITLKDHTVDMCKEACEKETTFHCMSFDYYHPSFTCYLKTYSRYGYSLSKNSNYEFYERNCYDKYRSCPLAEKAKWFGPIHGSFLSGANPVTLTKVTVDECKLACLQMVDFHCMGFDYDHYYDNCRLKVLNREMGGILYDNANYDYYELVSCPEAELVKVPAKNCKWMEPVKAYLSRNDMKTLSSVTEDQCMKSCEEEDDFECLSFDYVPSRKLCYLQKVNRRTHVVSMHSSYVYHERDCDSHYTEHCKWEGPYEGKYISGNDYKTLSGLTEEECMEACESEETFRCLSFDYLYSSQRCYLSLKNMYNARLSKSTSYAYYERNCYDEFRTCSEQNKVTWEGPIQGKYLASYDLLSLPAKSIDECKTACVQQEDFHCISFDYRRKDRYCFLQGVSRKDYQLTTQGDYEYYEIVKCSGNKTTAPNEKPKIECTWVGPKEGHYISSNDRKILYRIDLDECKKACEDENSFECMSFDYYKSVRYCYLQSVDRHSASLSAHAAFDYYERRCNDPYPKQCEWRGPYTDRYLSGYDHKVVNAITEEECYKACEDEETFYCLSFDYLISAKRCYLSRNNAYGLKLSTSTAYSYYERDCHDKFRYCNGKSNAVWLGPLHGKYINANLQSMNNMDPDSCKLACLQIKDFHCLGFFYKPSNSYCYLTSKNRESADLLDHVSYDYYELLSCPSEDAATSTKAAECKWLEAVTERYISGNDKLTLTDYDIDSCKKACEDAISFDCRSFDVYSKYCYLSDKDRSTSQLSTHRSFTYYERDCSSTYTEECKWAPVVNRAYIAGNDAKTVYTADVEECKKACESETDFNCVSFDFYRDSERCYLQRVNLYSGVKLSTNDNYDYYERDCYNKYRDCKEGAAVVWDGPYHGWYTNNNMVTLTGIEDIDHCKAACIQRTDFHCRAIVYTRSNKYCYLQAVNRDSTQLLPHSGYDYYEIVSCELKAPAKEPELKFKWNDAMKGKYISGLDKKTLTNYDLEDCKRECENSESFKCHSFDFIPTRRTCYLQELTRHTAVLSAHASYEYYEMDYEDNFPEECEWEEPMLRKYMGGYKKALTKIEPDDCKKACEQEDTFFCVSFDYYVPSRACYLNQQNMYTKKVATNNNYNHYERNCFDKYKGCFDGAAAEWYGPKHGKYIHGQDLKALSYMSVEDCKRACLQETTFNCRSFDYHRSSKICYLQAVTSEEYSLIDSHTNDYYELLKCAEPEKDNRHNNQREEEEVEKNCKWVGPINNYYMSGQDRKTINDVLASDCMKACEDETTFECISFDYYYDIRRCYLQDKDRSTVKLSTSGSYQYYERDCSPNFPEKCRWEGPVKDRYLKGYDYTTVNDVSVEECKNMCEEECSFNCISFDYYKSIRRCYLSLANRYNNVLSTSTAYDFYERNCYDTYRLCEADSEAQWVGPSFGKSLYGFANHKTIHTITVDECKRACQQADTFHCRAFRWLRSNGNCYLTSYSSEDREIVEDVNYNLYELKGCPGEQPEMEESEVTECVPEDFYVASCSCSGDPHCYSFDKKWLHFQGTCHYVLARDNCKDGVPHRTPTWEVINNNDGLSPSATVSYIRQAQVNLYEYDLKIGLYSGYVTVNGVRVQGSPMRYANGKVKITLAGATTYVSVKGGIQVQFSNSYIKVNVQTSHRDNVCGLCGNFNGDSADDWTIGDSEYCMSKYPDAVTGEITTDTNIMGTSWTKSLDETDAKCLRECPNPPTPSGCDTATAFKADEHCEILDDDRGVFRTCLAKMSEEQKEEVFQNCAYDACNLDNYEDVVCRHASSLAKICIEQYNIKVTWRSTSFCPMECGENMEYKSCGDPCLPTCADRDGVNCGDLGPCTEGCFCKSGFVYDGKSKCIPEKDCGCEVTSLGIYINVGESWKATDCSESCTCESAGAELDCEDMTCSTNYECGTKNGEPACVCDAPFVEDDGECKELEYPCDEDEEDLQCFTCSSTNDDDCAEFGKLETCTQRTPICSYNVTKNADGEITKVDRGCVKKDTCIADSIGPTATFCEESVGNTVCSNCNYGDENSEEGALVTYECTDKIEPISAPPQPGSPCDKSLDKGTGSDQEVKYYYDKNAEKCSEFIYGGSGGNANNFESMEECEEACTPSVQPPVVAAPQPESPCEMSVDKGNGTDQELRYYYDKDAERCSKFKYRGSGGNRNNFESKEECEEACIPSVLPPVTATPQPGSLCEMSVDKGTGTGQELRYYYDKDAEKCSKFKYRGSGGNTNNFESKEECEEACIPSVQVPVAAAPQLGGPCNQSLDKGNGTDQELRYYYDKNAEKCSKFKYSGSGGNSNNFESKDKCEEACTRAFQAPAFCFLPQDKGSECENGKSSRRYAFNANKGKCKKLHYTGCGGNENNFPNKKQCRIICKGK